jgi:hypothetical protein
MFVSNTELLKKLLQVETKVDQNKNREDYVDQNKNDNIYTRLDMIEHKLNNIDSSVNQIYFENQIIKHQLLLEDRIRESVNEIDDLAITIKQSISKIDQLVEMLLKERLREN